MPGRTYSNGNSYRYGFNGKENDNEVRGEGGQQDYGMRIYDPRIGKFLSVDPITRSYPWYTPYQFAGNKPIVFVDVDGLEEGSLEINTRRREEAYLSGKIKDDQYSAQTKASGLWGTLTTVAVVDLFLTKGRITQLLLTSQLFGTLHHNKATSPEQSAERGRETLRAVRDASTGYVVGRLIGALSRSPTIGRSSLTALEEDGYAVVRDQAGASAGKAWLANGELNLAIKTTGTELKGRGADVFRSLHDFINVNFGKITTIKGTWQRGSYQNNLDQFNNYLKQGFSESEAALKTFTGVNADKLGFNNATILKSSQKDANGVYTSVDVIFSKPTVSK